MPECPNCGCTFFYCIECGEPCSDDEGVYAGTVTSGRCTDEDEGIYICENCDAD